MRRDSTPWTRLVVGVGAAALLGLVTIGGAVADVVLIGRPVLSTPGASAEKYLDEQFIRAAASAADAYPGLSVTYQGFALRTPAAPSGSSPAVRIGVVATPDAGSRMIVLNGESPSGATESVVHQLSWSDSLHRELASMIGYLYGVLGRTDEPPRGSLAYLQDFSTDFIATGDLPMTSIMQPYSMSGLPGRLFVGSGNFILETDTLFREQAKHGVGTELTGFWAMHTAITPAGTLVGASLAQQGLVRLVPGIATPFRLPTRASIMNMAVTEDGTAFTVDMEQSFMRIAPGSIGRLDLDLPQGTYISFMAAGPDNTLLLWEPTHRAILQYDSDGNRLGMVLPQVSMTVGIGMRAFSAYPNGDILALFIDRIIRFSRTGEVVWQVMAADLPEVGQFMMHTSMHADHESGLVYLLNIQLKRIVQLLDVGAIEERRELTTLERRLLASSERLRDNPYDQAALVERAGIYEEVEAWEAAAYVWETAYAIDPTRRTVAQSREAALVRRLEENAERLYRQTVGLLDTLGPASAGYAYQRAQAEYEALIGRAADSTSARARLEELRRRYEQASAPDERRQPLSIRDVVLADLFPALYAVYQTTPAGSVVVRNDGTEPIEDVTVTTEMRFLDFPTPGGSVRSIAPGEMATLPLRLPISAETLRIQESSPVPVRVSISYRSDGRSGEASVVEIVTMHRATALTWDVSAKLAAFVTPRDEVVETFAAAFTDIGPASEILVSSRFFRAALIADAVGALGIQYIEDPSTGITQVLGNPMVVDTVRFPRNTLRIGIADCDDTTALLASLYESVGIGTAIMTSPGHVFLAFDTGEPAANSWLFESDLTSAISHAGTVWLPFETTILDQGFLASWREGSRLYKRHHPQGQIEFLPVVDQWLLFPPLPLDPASFSITSPPRALVDPAYRQSLTDVRATLYERSVAGLAAGLPQRDAAGQVRTLNQLGVLHGMFGEYAEADRALRRATEIDPNHRAAYINLANLEILTGEPRAALGWLDRAERVRPGGGLVTLLRAQANHLAGDFARASEQMTLLNRIAPDLYAQNTHLVGAPDGARASEAAARPVLPWSLDGE